MKVDLKTYWNQVFPDGLGSDEAVSVYHKRPLRLAQPFVLLRQSDQFIIRAEKRHVVRLRDGLQVGFPERPRGLSHFGHQENSQEVVGWQVVIDVEDATQFTLSLCTSYQEPQRDGNKDTLGLDRPHRHQPSSSC
jgi:hypothetical protein